MPMFQNKNYVILIPIAYDQSNYITWLKLGQFIFSFVLQLHLRT
jgi:hypothetical protein